MPRICGRLGLVEDCILLCDMLSYAERRRWWMGGGRKINWQLNDTPCEDDKRHLVAQEEVGSEGLCNEGPNDYS